MCLFPGRRTQRTFYHDTRRQLSWPQLSAGEETPSNSDAPIFNGYFFVHLIFISVAYSE